MKEIELSHWITPNTGATNESAFTGLPNGYRYSTGSFFAVNYSGYWWSSSQYDTTQAISRSLNTGIINIVTSNSNKKYGFSVRLIKD